MTSSDPPDGKISRDANWFVRATGGLIRRVHTAVFDRDYDTRHGVETAGVRQPHELSVSGANASFGAEYAPTPSWVFRRALSTLEIDAANFAFVDFGSGKGRTLLLAADWPFSLIEGVEFAAELHQIAGRNIRIFGANGCPSGHINIHHMDATAYPIPEMPCVFYFYNPFGNQVLSRVLDNIETSFRRRPRPMYFIYLNPKHQEVFERRSFLQLKPRTLPSRLLDRVMSPEPFTVFQTIGSSK